MILTMFETHHGHPVMIQIHNMQYAGVCNKFFELDLWIILSY